MTVDFNILKRNELRAAVRLVGRAFEDYEYFTNYFPDLEESTLRTTSPTWKSGERYSEALSIGSI